MIVAAVKQLLVEPNVADPLMIDVAQVYMNDREEFKRLAQIHK